MPSDSILLLTHSDPASALAPRSLEERESLRRQIVAEQPQARRTNHLSRFLSVRLRRRQAGVGALIGAALFVGGGAWASGALNPLALFQGSPATVFANDPEGANFDAQLPEQVVPSTVVQGGTASVPSVGTVTYWWGATQSGGFCSGLQLPGGSWFGEPGAPDNAGGGGGPACDPTREQLVAGEAAPYDLDGFDYGVGELNAGSDPWEIFYGELTVTGAVRVSDLTSGATTTVNHGNLFVLAEPNMSPPPPGTPVFEHLVAYNAAGQIIADTGTPGHNPQYGPGASPTTQTGAGSSTTPTGTSASGASGATGTTGAN